MTESRKLAAIVAADIVGDSRRASADEERVLMGLRPRRSGLVTPTIAMRGSRVVKRREDGVLAEFRGAIDADALRKRNPAWRAERSRFAPKRRIEALRKAGMLGY